MAIRHRRGFVKESEEYALEFREELNLSKNDPLCPRALAKLLAIPVTALSQHPAINDQIKNHFLTVAPDVFSATTIPNGTSREILHNDGHHPKRQNSNIAHEIAHVLLGHPPKPPMMENGCRNFDKVLEREAHDLGFTLLIPKYAALYAIENFFNLSLAGDYYGVSEKLLEYRIRKTDVRGWSNNRKKKQYYRR